MHIKLKFLLSAGLGLSLLQATYVPQATALNDEPPLMVYYCYHVVDGVPEFGPYAMVGPLQMCPPVPDSAQFHNKNTPTEHDCQVDRSGNEI